MALYVVAQDSPHSERLIQVREPPFCKRVRERVEKELRGLLRVDDGVKVVFGRETGGRHVFLKWDRPELCVM